MVAFTSKGFVQNVNESYRALARQHYVEGLSIEIEQPVRDLRDVVERDTHLHHLKRCIANLLVSISRKKPGSPTD